MSNAPACPYDRLYRDHHGWLEGRLRRRTGSANDAADLAHDTFVRILKTGRLPGPGQSRAFLAQVAKGLAIDMHRRRQLERAYLAALSAMPEAAAPSEEHRHQIVEVLTLIDKALDGLPEPVREVFLLSRFEGLTYVTIAAQKGIAVATVRKYMARAATACLAVLI